jgi:hypothetical protein
MPSGWGVRWGIWCCSTSRGRLSGKKEEWWERGEVEEREQDGVRVVVLRV